MLEAAKDSGSGRAGEARCIGGVLLKGGWVHILEPGIS